jgi:hypothetical protein
MKFKEFPFLLYCMYLWCVDNTEIVKLQWGSYTTKCVHTYWIEMYAKHLSCLLDTSSLLLPILCDLCTNHHLIWSFPAVHGSVTQDPVLLSNSCLVLFGNPHPHPPILVPLILLQYLLVFGRMLLCMLSSSSGSQVLNMSSLRPFSVACTMQDSHCL